MIHMSNFTGIVNPMRDQQISKIFSILVVSINGRLRRKVGRGDDSTLSLDGFVARAFPDPQRGGPKIMIETEPGEKELPLVPHKKPMGDSHGNQKTLDTEITPFLVFLLNGFLAKPDPFYFNPSFLIGLHSRLEHQITQHACVAFS